jgi:arsenate reductase (glutaredoxin)
MNVTIFHNARCAKSRATLQLLQDNGYQPEIVDYLKTPPSADELRGILNLLALKPRQLMRSNEAEYRELGLDSAELSDDQLIEAMVRTPKLIERPIVLCNGKAAVGRPPENVLAILP